MRLWGLDPCSLQQGFTSGEADGVPGADIAMGSVALEGSDWEAEWVEGTHVDGEVQSPNDVSSSVAPGPKTPSKLRM